MAKSRSKSNPSSRPGTQAAARNNDGNKANDAHEEHPLYKYLPLVCGGLLFYVLWFCVANSGRLETLLIGISRPDLIVRSWFDAGLEGRIAPVGFFDRLPVLLVVLLVLVFAWTWGITVLRFLLTGKQKFSWFTAAEIHALALGIGLNLLPSILMLLSYLRGTFRPAGVVTVVFVMATLALVALHVCFGRDFKLWYGTKLATDVADSPEFHWSTPTWARWLIVGTLSLFTFFLIWGAILPPLDFDVREYHLQIPKEWYQQGQITATPHNIYGNMPLAAESTSLVGMLLFDSIGYEDAWWWGALAGKTIMACYLPMTAVLLYAAGRRFFGSNVVGILAAALCLTSPWLIQIGHRGLNENAFAFYLVAAIYPLAMAASQVWRNSGRAKENSEENATTAKTASSEPTEYSLMTLLVLSLWMTGCAIAVKYTAVVFVLAPVVVVWLLVLVQAWRKRSESSSQFHVKSVLLGACGVCLAMVVTAGPWLIKNVAATGNSVYPLASNWLGDPWHDAEQQQRWQQAHATPGFSGEQFTRAFTIFLAQPRGHHPLLLPLCLVAAISTLLTAEYSTGFRSRLLVLMAAVALFSLLWFLFTHRLERFLIPMLPLSCLLATAGVICIHHKVWRWTLVAAFVLAAGVNFLEITTPAESMRDTRFFASLRYLKDDWAASPRPSPTRINPAHSWLNANVPAGQRVLLVGDAQPFDLNIALPTLPTKGSATRDYIQPPVLYNTCFDDCVLEELTKGKSAEEKLATLQAAGVGYVLIHWSELARYRSEGNYGYSDYVTPELIETEFLQPGIFTPVPEEEVGVPAEVLQVFTVPVAQEAED